MDIFISWSGTRSCEVAKLLDRWLQQVIQAVNPWISTRDIDKGSQWFSDINDQLAGTTNGLIVLTKENLNNPWILFEAGALAKGVNNNNRLFTFLVDIEDPVMIKDPLARFNHTKPEEQDLRRLVHSINKGLEGRRLKTEILNAVYDMYWPKFEEEFQQILRDYPANKKALKFDKEDVMYEILRSVRGLDRRLAKVENEDYININRSNIRRNGSFSNNEELKLMFDSGKDFSNLLVDDLVNGLTEKDIINKYGSIMSDSEILSAARLARKSINKNYKGKI